MRITVKMIEDKLKDLIKFLYKDNDIFIEFG